MSTDQARDEFYAARKAARDARRAFSRSADAGFVRTMQNAMREYATARAAGVSRDDACKGIEAVLRDAWPHRPSKFDAKCALCDDTGWRELYCDDRMRCGRERCAKNPEIQHAYVEPCQCAEGDKKRKRTWSGEDQIAAVGKTSKKRGGFARLGQ